MTVNNPEGTHTKYTETDRHFAPCSETYTGADSLITAERNGWRTFNVVYRETLELSGGRETALYYFKLHRDGSSMIMPIVRNPFVTKLLARRRMRVLPTSNTSTETHESAVVADAIAKNG